MINMFTSAKSSEPFCGGSEGAGRAGRVGAMIYLRLATLLHAVFV